MKDRAVNRPRTRRRAGITRCGTALAAVAAVGVAAAPQAGCSSKKPPRAREVTMIERDLPPILRNTIGSEVTFRGMQPAIISGYGLVVNLNGTGSGDVPLGVRSMMVNEMTRMGVGGELAPPALQRSPDDVIDSPNTAVVLVRAIVPPAAPVGTRFDARVSALQASSTTSLAGGRLYTTLMYRGQPVPGGPATQPVARASGELFLNPFIDPDAAEASPDVLIAKVINGGLVSNPLTVALILDNPSHTRARAIVNAINAKFPQGSSREPTARGKSEEAIELIIPSRYAERPGDFINLVRHTRIDQRFPDEWARRYTEELKANPGMAPDLAWCLRSLGQSSVKFLRPMYTYPEPIPRIAAVTTGAALGDMTTQPYLEELVLTGAPSMPSIRVDAVRLLGDLAATPDRNGVAVPHREISTFLRSQLNSPHLDVRVAAYEALLQSSDPLITSQFVDGKFVVDLVPSETPMIYYTQHEEPRIALFGGNLAVNRPVFVYGWDGRLQIVSSDGAAQDIGLLYRDPRSSIAQTGHVRPTILDVIEFLGHTPTAEDPAPGFGLSYSEVIGALYAMYEGGAVAATFRSQEDKLMLEMQRIGEQNAIIDRPELSAQGAVDEVVAEETIIATEGEVPEIDVERLERRRRYVIPIAPPIGETSDADQD